MRKSFLSSFVALILSFSFITPYVYAAKSVDQLKQEMEEREKERKKIEKEINAKKDDRNEKIAERNRIDLQISDLISDIEDTQATINEKQKEIDEKQKEINELNVLIEQNKETLKRRMKVMYEYGTSSYLELILEAKGLSDFFTRLSVIKDIVKHDQNLITTYSNAKKEIEEAQNKIKLEQQEQIEARDILNSKKSELKKLQSEQQAIINEINADIKLLEKQEKQKEDDYNSLMAELNKALGSSGNTSYTGSGKFVWPSAASKRVTSQFGQREKPNAAATSNHRGIDIGAPAGTDVLAAEAGTVVTAGYNRSYGYYLTINHGGGIITLYAHNSRLLVSSGMKVSRGQVIAKVGSTGNSTGPHIHFEVRVNGTYKNPMNYF